MSKTSNEVKRKKVNEKLDTLTNVGIAGTGSELVQRYGSANKEFLVGYGGKDNETGQVLKKGLKDISKSKVNPDYKDNNIHQQAGFSAEVESTSRHNADNIVNGKKTRRSRTDDIGRVNDPLEDHVELDANGKPIPGTGTQMKFVGKGGDDTLSKLMSNKYNKYFDNDVPIEVPSDYYDSVREAAAKKADSLQEQIDRLKKDRTANKEIIAEKEKQLKKLKDIESGKSLKKSNVSSKDAEFARLHPELSTAKDIAKYSHQAGVEAAKSGAALAGGMSLVRNIVAVAKGDKDADEAVIAVVKDTGTGAAVSYGTTFLGSAIKGGMQNAGDATIRSLSKTNLPAMIVTTAIETGKTLTKFANGEIDGTECVIELGEKGTGMIAGTAGGAMGSAVASAAFGETISVVIGSITTIAIPIPIIGTIIGSMIGYALSSILYNQFIGVLVEAKVAHEERLRIEAECAEAIEAIREYRAQMEQMVSAYLSDHILTFHSAFDKMKDALNIGDIDGFIAGTNMITVKLGGKPQFNSMNEFDALMQGDEALKL